jgi:hypothetical protein
LFSMWIPPANKARGLSSFLSVQMFLDTLDHYALIALSTKTNNRRWWTQDFMQHSDINPLNQINWIIIKLCCTNIRINLWKI